MHMLAFFALIHHALGALAARLDRRDDCESHVIIVEIKFNGLNRSRLNLSDITLKSEPSITTEHAMLLSEWYI